MAGRKDSTRIFFLNVSVLDMLSHYVVWNQLPVEFCLAADTLVRLFKISFDIHSQLLMKVLLQKYVNLFSLVQIGSCTNQMGQIAIVSFQNSSPKVIECFNVESRILCMVYIPEEDKNKSSVPPEPEDMLAKPSCVPTVCLGMEEGRYISYILGHHELHIIYLAFHYCIVECWLVSESLKNRRYLTGVVHCLNWSYWGLNDKNDSLVVLKVLTILFLCYRTQMESY